MENGETYLDPNNDSLVWNRDMQNMLQTIPKVPSIDILQDMNDIILYKGLKKLNDMLDDDEETSMQKTKIFSAAVNLGRYIDVRKEHELEMAEKNRGITFGDDSLIVKAETVDENQED